MPEGLAPSVYSHPFKVGFQTLEFLPDLATALVDLLRDLEDANLLRFILEAQSIFEKKILKGARVLKADL